VYALLICPYKKFIIYLRFDLKLQMAQKLLYANEEVDLVKSSKKYRGQVVAL
jgi:hypothetical protein